MLQASWLRNHPSWELPIARVKARTVKLGGKFGQWLFRGALEWVPPWAPPPTYVEPMGAVPKKGPDEFQAISDARHGNKESDPWGVKYYTVKDFKFTDLLDWCYIVNSTDWRDACHNTKMSDCTGEVVVGVGVIGIKYVCAEDDSGSEASEEEDSVELGDPSSAARYSPTAEGQREAKAMVRRYHSRQRPVWVYKSHIGCLPKSCLQACDKSACGCATDGCVMWWAGAHFGQSPACSGLNCMALCLLRHLARRDPYPGERRGASGRSILGGRRGGVG